MLLLAKPSAERIAQFIATQRTRDFTYSSPGATASTIPPGYVIDRTRAKLGEGKMVFQSAISALRRWEQFRLGWVQASPADTPLRPGETVAVIARILGLWWLNACRIVYVVDEAGPVVRFGFAYGTLPEHAESGEERFVVEWNPANDEVWYDILAFSRPRQWLARLGYPFVRRFQKRFARHSALAMQRAVAKASQ